MKRSLQLLAVVLVAATLGVWVAQGANTGWTKNRVQVKSVDPITEIEASGWEDKFVPGVDFLGSGLMAAGALFVGSLFIRKSNKQQQTQHS